jgi:hypothetical protein
MDPRDEGLGISVLIYAAALAGALAAIVLPVYLANAPAVYQNSGAKSFSEVLAARGEAREYPLAKLERPQIVDPAVVTALNAKAQTKSDTDSRPHIRHRAERTSRQPIGRRRSYADATAARPPDPLSLFFSIFR